MLKVDLCIKVVALIKITTVQLKGICCQHKASLSCPLVQIHLFQDKNKQNTLKSKSSREVLSQ